MSCTAVWVLSWVLGTASDKMDHVLGLPYGPAVKTPSFQCRDVGSIPGQGTKIPHATWGAKKLKKKKKSCPCADGLWEREENTNQGITKNIEMVSRDPRSGEQGAPQGGGGKRETQKVQCAGAAGSLCPQDQPGGQWTGGGSGG